MQISLAFAHVFIISVMIYLFSPSVVAVCIADQGKRRRN
jgi:hypothetical protein